MESLSPFYAPGPDESAKPSATVWAEGSTAVLLPGRWWMQSAGRREPAFPDPAALSVSAQRAMNLVSDRAIN